MDPIMIETECGSSGTTLSPKAGTLKAEIALEPSWHQAADQDLEENEIISHLIKSEYEVQDNWWYEEWNDDKKEHDGGRECIDSDVEDDDSQDGDYVCGSSGGEHVGDGDRKDGDFVDDDEDDFDVGIKSLFPSNLKIKGYENEKQATRSYMDRKRYCFEPYIMRDCPFCGMVFDSIYPWKRHMDEYHNFSTRDGSYYNYVDDNQAMCKTCNAVVRNRISALKMHVVKHLPYTKIFKCKTCSYANTTMEKVRKHIENKHFDLVHVELTELTKKKILRKCVYCSDFFGSLRKLSNHIRKEHSHTFKHKMQFVCPVCGQSFSGEKSWKTHLQQKHQFDTLEAISFEYINHLASEDAKTTTTFRCLKCRRTFGNTYLRYHLVNHAFNHLPYKSYKCTFCNYDCLKKDNLIAHTCENLLTEIESKPYLKDKPSSIEYLSLKKKIEIIDKLFVCPSCEQHFESVTLWSEHLTKVHNFHKIENLNIKEIHEENSKRNHKCLICDKNFPRPQLKILQMHAFSHMPYMWTKCKFCLTPISYCTKCTCKWKSKYVKLGFIAYVCPRCGKEFGSAQRWESHIVSEHNLRNPTKLNFSKINKIENEIPLYKCELCNEFINESPSSSDLLFNHATSKHMPFKSYKCKNCSESFENMDSILIHLNCCKTNGDKQLKNVLEEARCQCYVCGYLGNGDDDVDAHFSKEHKFNAVKNSNFSWICIICDFKYNSKEKIMEHISRRHTNKLYREDNSRIKFLCPVSSGCPAHFDSKHEWRSHVSIFHAFNTDEELGMKKTGNVWKCLECGKVIKQRSSKLTHKFIHFNELRFQCRICDCTYRSLKYTRKHALKCTGQHKSPFHFKIKQLVLAKKKKNREEQKSNNVKNTEQTDSYIHADPLQVDENTFQTSMATEKSVLLNEFEEYVTFACPECNIQLDNKTDWHAHINKNHDFFLDNNLNITPKPGMKKKATCNECGCTIHGGSQLIAQRHKLTHMPYSAFVCRLCNHRSKTQNVLIYHIQRRHLKLGTYPCYFCDMVCQTYVERYEHTKSQHNGVKWPENVCEICMISLKSVSAMEQHMTTHDFDRTTFPCGYCKRKYLHTSERTKHWKTHHPVEYEAKLAEQPIARKVGIKKKCDQKKPSSSTRVKRNAHSDDSDDSTYSPIKNPKSKKKVKKTTISSKVTTDIKKFDVEPDFEVKREPGIQHPVELEFEPVARNSETKKNCKRKKSSNITRVKEEFHSYDDSDDSTYSPIKNPKSKKKVKKTTNSSKVTTDIKKFDVEPDFEVKREPEIQHPVELEFEPIVRNSETKKNYKRKKSSNITRVKEEFHSYEDSDESTYSPIQKPFLKGKRKPTRKNLRTAREVGKSIYELRSEPAKAVEKNIYELGSELDCNVKSEPESEFEYIV